MQCVGLSGIYWQNVKFIIMFSLVYNRLKVRCFFTLMSLLHLQRKQVLFDRFCRERTNLKFTIPSLLCTSPHLHNAFLFFQAALFPPTFQTGPPLHSSCKVISVHRYYDQFIIYITFHSNPFNSCLKVRTQRVGTTDRST